MFKYFSALKTTDWMTYGLHSALNNRVYTEGNAAAAADLRFTLPCIGVNVKQRVCCVALRCLVWLPVRIEMLYRVPQHHSTQSWMIVVFMTMIIIIDRSIYCK